VAKKKKVGASADLSPNCARYEDRQRKTAAPIDRREKGTFEEEQQFA
jgi:hypothetical protein